MRRISAQVKPFGSRFIFCLRTDLLTIGGGTSVLVRRGIAHHAESVPGLRHLEAIAIEINLAGRPLKILAVYLLSPRPLLKSNLTAWLSCGLPVHIAGYINDKHVDLQLSANHGKGQTCVIMPVDTPA